MIYARSPDLTQSTLLAAHNNQVKTDLEVTSAELTSGLKQNLVEATSGDLSLLFSIDKTLSDLQAESSALRMASGKIELTQSALDNIHDNLVEFGPALLSAVERGDHQTSQIYSRNARQILESVISSLNVKYGSHSIFSGAAVGQSAIAPSDKIISDISEIMNTAVNTDAAFDAIDTYFFGVEGRFETDIFLGSPQNAPPFRDSEGNITDYAQRADSSEIRHVIRALAIATAASEQTSFPSAGEHFAFLKDAALSSLDAVGGIIRLREELGFVEKHFEDENVRNLSMRNVFELERNSIVAADPFETATKFEALQGQLQTIYTVTARLSGLSLVNYLR